MYDKLNYHALQKYMESQKDLSSNFTMIIGSVFNFFICLSFLICKMLPNLI